MLTHKRPKKLTKKYKSFKFVESLRKDYYDNSEAMKFIHKLGRKAKYDKKLQKKLAN